jgi:2-methylfumaryl-CoA isomerase
VALRTVTGTGDVFAALEKALGADLAQEADRYRLRDTIAAVLKPWFADRDSTTVARELDAARVLWGRYQGMVDVVTAHRAGRHPVLADLELVDGSSAITARSPLRWNGEHGEAGRAPELGRDTEAVLTEVLGLTAREFGRLVDGHVVAPPPR